MINVQIENDEHLGKLSPFAKFSCRTLESHFAKSIQLVLHSKPSSLSFSKLRPADFYWDQSGDSRPLSFSIRNFGLLRPMPIASSII